jgi:hypothetical protein
MNRCLYPAKVVLVGLFTAQVISTIQVYLSNIDLYAKLTSIREAGYLPVPNQHVMDGLQELGPAFFGGIFFTLTVGASLSLISFAVGWFWFRLLSRNRFALIPFVLLWLGCVFYINLGGFSPIVTAYFLIIPPVVFAALCHWASKETRQKVWVGGIIHVLPILLLALVWASQLGNYMFVDIRDYLLLSNPLGRKINDFYYEYTFYPAEVFKPLNDKILKTCNLEAVKQQSMAQSLERLLRNYDYLNTGPQERVDLQIVLEGKGLLFQNKGEIVLRTTLQDFFSRPGELLREFSSKIDPYVLFRQFTFLSLLIGFPVFLYVVVQALTCAASSLFVTPRSSSIIASAFCFLFGILLLIPVHLSKARELDVQDLSDAIESERWQDRVAALKVIQDKQIDVATFGTYQKMRMSSHVPERYLLARALKVSREPEAYDALIAFLDDPSPNVVSMAFYALGKKGDRRAIREIKTRLEASDNWYNQWYAYKALRSLGWKQTRSKQRR